VGGGSRGRRRRTAAAGFDLRAARRVLPRAGRPEPGVRVRVEVVLRWLTRTSTRASSASIGMIQNLGVESGDRPLSSKNAVVAWSADSSAGGVFKCSDRETTISVIDS